MDSFFDDHRQEIGEKPHVLVGGDLVEIQGEIRHVIAQLLSAHRQECLSSSAHGGSVDRAVDFSR